MNPTRLCIGLILLLSVSGCVSYKNQPLVPEDIFSEIEELRQEPLELESGTLTFVKATELMDQNSPQLHEIRSKYEVTQSIADIKTPWFNPSIEIGADLGSQLEPGVTGKTRPFIGLGFTLPLGGKFSKNDDLNQAQALRDFIEIQARHRELYFNLRASYTHLLLMQQKKEVQQNLVKASKTMLKANQTLMNVGATTALDVGMVELDTYKTELELIEIESELENLRAELSVLLGIDVKQVVHLSKSSLPQIKQNIPHYETLKTKLIDNHLDLARLRFDYEIAEKNLRLEISKQYPDIHFGAEREKEIGEDQVVLGLRLGIEVPLFDRNQQGIARATKERKKIRKQYIARVHEALSQLNNLHENIKNNQQRQKILIEVIKPQAENNLKIAKQALESGGLDALKYLDVLRTYQESMKEAALIENDVRMTWIELEKLLGVPLIPYPGEQQFDIPLNVVEKMAGTGDFK